jgi:hypothetical protein
MIQGLCRHDKGERNGGARVLNAHDFLALADPEEGEASTIG